MAIYRSLLVLLLIVIALFSRISISEAKSSFSFESLGKKATFNSEDIALYGDAKLVDGGSSIQLTDSVSHGGGRIVYKKPIESAETKTHYYEGFTTVFSFSMPPGRGGRLGFLVFPANGTYDQSFLEAKFDISENFIKSRDSNVTVIVNGTMVSENTGNLTVANLEMEKEKKKDKSLLYAWISYQARWQYLSVYVTKSERFRSAQSLMIYQIDLLKGEDEFMVGIKSYSGNFNLHSWKLGAGFSPKNILHSELPIYLEKLEKEEDEKRRRRERMWEVVTFFVTTFGSTGLVFFAMMHIWAAFKRNSLVIEECVLKTKEFECEKMEKIVVVMSVGEAQQVKK